MAVPFVLGYFLACFFGNQHYVAGWLLSRARNNGESHNGKEKLSQESSLNPLKSTCTSFDPVFCPGCQVSWGRLLGETNDKWV